MATPEDLQSTINSQTLETFRIHHFVCFFGSWDLHISGNGPIFYVYTDRMYFVFLLPSLMWRGRTASVLRAGTAQRVCRITVCVCMGVHMPYVCVVAREDAGAACAYRRVTID